MHEDLLDAVDWAVKQKITTKDKVAIYGGSYGGYATLVGVTFTPDTFACGVDIVGPSNLNTLLGSIPPYWKAFYEEFASRVGDPRTEEGKKLLNERSPLSRVDAIKKPLLIAQGANDPRVKQAEADQIVKSMKDKNLPVTYVLYPDEGHGFARPMNRTSFYAIAEGFLSQCLGGRYEPVGNDFKGASLKVLEGASLQPFDLLHGLVALARMRKDKPVLARERHLGKPQWQLFESGLHVTARNERPDKDRAKSVEPRLGGEHRACVFDGFGIFARVVEQVRIAAGVEQLRGFQFACMPEIRERFIDAPLIRAQESKAVPHARITFVGGTRRAEILLGLFVVQVVVHRDDAECRESRRGLRVQLDRAKRCAATLFHRVGDRHLLVDSRANIGLGQRRPGVDEIRIFLQRSFEIADRFHTVPNIATRTLEFSIQIELVCPLAARALRLGGFAGGLVRRLRRGGSAEPPHETHHARDGRQRNRHPMPVCDDARPWLFRLACDHRDRPLVNWPKLPDEPVANTRQRLDVARCIGVIAQHHTKLSYDRVQAVVEIHDAFGPQHFDQALSRDHITRMSEQLHENPQRLLWQTL
jgi:dienelactone hydrolase